MTAQLTDAGHAVEYDPDADWIPIEESQETVGRLVEIREELRELQIAVAENAEAYAVEKQRKRFDGIIADVIE